MLSAPVLLEVVLDEAGKIDFVTCTLEFPGIPFDLKEWLRIYDYSNRCFVGISLIMNEMNQSFQVKQLTASVADDKI